MRVTYERRDVILADVVFSGGLGSKARPIVILSTEVYNQSGIKLIGAAITSNLFALHRPCDILLNGWSAAGLLLPSAVRGIIVTVDQIDVHRILGIMSAPDFAEVEKELIEILGF